MCTKSAISASNWRLSAPSGSRLHRGLALAAIAAGPPRVRPDVLARFVNHVEAGYCFDPARPNKYHTNVHAADVVQAVGCFLVVPRLASMLSQLDALCLLLAAVSARPPARSACEH